MDTRIKHMSLLMHPPDPYVALINVLLLIEESRTPFFLPYQDSVNLMSQNIKMLDFSSILTIAKPKLSRWLCPEWSSLTRPRLHMRKSTREKSIGNETLTNFRKAE